MSRIRNAPYCEPLTVIIPARNAEETIERAICSAVNAGADRVFVFDDASTDGTFEILSDLFERSVYPPLEYFSVGEFRAGVVFARNFLIENSDYGLIVPLDADDALRDIKPLKEAYREGTWVYSDYAEHAGESITIIQAPPPGMLARKNICNATMLFHKRDWDKVKGYDVDFAWAEDWAFQAALTNGGIQPVHVEQVCYDRYLHPKGNERTAKAEAYWSFYRDLARSKYKAIFAGTG